MHRTNLSVDEMLADDDHAAAYTRRGGVIVAVPQRPLPAIAPAGAINSSAADMSGGCWPNWRAGNWTASR
jgi:hypothetical protein